MEPIRAFLFGVTIAAPIGPIALLLVHTGLNHRTAAALRAALGVAVADLTYAFVALAMGAALTTVLSAHQAGLQIFSSLLLVALGVWLVGRALRAPSATALEEQAPGVIKLYLLTLANPLTIVLFAAFAGQLHADGLAAIVVDALCLFAGSRAVQAAYAIAGALLQRWVTDAAAVRRFNVASSAGIALFGLYGLARVLM